MGWELALQVIQFRGLGNAVPYTNHKRNFQNSIYKGKMEHLITCISEGMGKGQVKSVDYDQVEVLTQERGESCCIFKSFVRDFPKIY